VLLVQWKHKLTMLMKIILFASKYSFLIHSSPPSAIVQFPIPFSVSLNNQQNTKNPIEYVFFDEPQGISILIIKYISIET